MSPNAASSIALAELLTVRLCHDLAGLCGTLSGALELAGDDPDSVAETVPVARQAAEELGARLRLLRAAWGQVAEPMNSAGLLALAAGLPGAHRLRLDFAGLAPGIAFNPERARVTLNALLLAGEALRIGGALQISGNEAGLVVAIEGNRAGWPTEVERLQSDPDCAVQLALANGPRGIQAPLLWLMAQNCGATLTLGPPATETGARALHVAWERR